jgi:hypothetical protein
MWKTKKDLHQAKTFLLLICPFSLLSHQIAHQIYKHNYCPRPMVENAMLRQLKPLIQSADKTQKNDLRRSCAGYFGHPPGFIRKNKREKEHQLFYPNHIILREQHNGQFASLTLKEQQTLDKTCHSTLDIQI